MTFSVSLEVTAAVDADEAFRRLIDFEQYPQMTSSVRSVDVEPSGEKNVLISTWAVDFRGGILRWTERDSIDLADRVLTFEQVVGDLESFGGRWQISPAASGCRIRFDAELDMGIPSLASIIDPIATAALRDNVLLILSGLLGQLRSPAGDVVESSTVHLHRADDSLTPAGRG